MKGRVFILQRKGLDYSSAAKFGEIIVVYEGERPPITNIAFQQKIEDFLLTHEFDPDRDYIMISGSAVNMHIYGAVVAGLFDKYAALIYSAESDEYFPIYVGLGEEISDARKSERALS